MMVTAEAGGVLLEGTRRALQQLHDADARIVALMHRLGREQADIDEFAHALLAIARAMGVLDAFEEGFAAATRAGMGS